MNFSYPPQKPSLTSPQDELNIVTLIDLRKKKKKKIILRKKMNKKIVKKEPFTSFISYLHQRELLMLPF